MPTLPVLSGRKVVKVFESPGWQKARQRGSHIIPVKEDHSATLSVPDHKEVAKGTLRALVRSAEITVTEFTAASQENWPAIMDGMAGLAGRRRRRWRKMITDGSGFGPTGLVTGA